MQSVATCNTIQNREHTSLVGSDAKNALPTDACTLDIMGLTWIFLDDEFQELSFTK